MATVVVEGKGRLILVDDETKTRIDLWAQLGPDERANIAAFLLRCTRLSSRINSPTLRRLENACRHRLETIEASRKPVEATV